MKLIPCDVQHFTISKSFIDGINLMHRNENKLFESRPIKFGIFGNKKNRKYQMQSTIQSYQFTNNIGNIYSSHADWFVKIANDFLMELCR